jgi:MoaA/NifB/PqqE/SkfB family radical SAM enzyme
MFCPRPFEQLYVTEDGDAHLCCPNWIAMPAGNVLATPPLAVWRSRVAGNIRKSMTDGNLRHCINCPHLPGPSGCVRSDTPAAEPSTERVATLTVAYDATCNLRCPSCRSEAKTSTARAVRVQEILLESGIFEHVDRLAASGSGDPLASPLFWDLLSALPAPRYPKLRLLLQTNGLLLANLRTWERLGEYARRIDEILLSVDAYTPKTYALNRGGKWSDLIEALDNINLRQIPLQLNFVVQANNFREMDDFARWARNMGARRAYFSALENWGTYAEADYLERAVHLPSHPRHAELLEVLGQESLQDRSRVTLAGLPRSR